jgi:hypothetical protein
MMMLQGVLDHHYLNRQIIATQHDLDGLLDLASRHARDFNGINVSTMLNRLADSLFLPSLLYKSMYYKISR